MYVYKITNLINQKIYIGITNNVEKRWGNEKSYPKDPKHRQVIQEAIHKYGKDNFEFKVLHRNLSIEEAIVLEEQYIKEFNSLVPNGYNVDPGGKYFPTYKGKAGADNNNANLTEEEAQYILDHRNIPICLLYEQFSEKIKYETFRKIYHHITYKNLTTTTEEYPFNREFAGQFSSGPLEYDDVVKLRERYAKGEYWKDVYEDYKWAYKDEMTFWNVYYGNRYKLVMPEVFTEENRKIHSSLRRAGQYNGRAKLTAQDVLKIREMHKEGVSNSEIYKAYPQVTPTSIRAVINGTTWKNLL